MNILVTGGTGFIGKHLVDALSEQHNVKAPPHSAVDFADQSAVEDYFKKNTFDLVVHTASVGGTRKGETHPEPLRTNLMMYFNIAKFHDGMIISLGSGAEYDKKNPIVHASEKDWGKSVPTDDYGLAKYIISLYAEERVLILRLFGVLGEGEDYEIRPVSNLICRSLFGLPVALHQNMILDYIDVNDLTKLILHFIEHPPADNVYNVTNGEHVDLLTLANIVRELAGANPVAIEKPGMNKEYSGDTSLLQAAVPNFAFTPLKDVVKRMYSWYAARKDDIDKDALLTY